MKARRLVSAAGLALIGAGAGAACNATDSQLVMLGVPQPMLSNGACLFPSQSTIFLTDITLDTGASFNLSLGVGVQNNAVAGMVNIGSMNTNLPLTYPNDVTPLRMEIRWECDSNGFTSNLGPLIVPAFSPSLPFCLDKRAGANQSFVGFDVVPAEGGAVPAAGSGLVFFKPIPYELGEAFNDTFRIGTLADQCCRAPGTSNCDGQDTTMGGACEQLQTIFSTIDPSGLKVKSDKPGTQSPDLVRFAPFAKFDGDYELSANPDKLDRSLNGARYPLTLRATLEGINGTGSLVVSDELVTKVQICRNCGPIDCALDTSGLKRLAYGAAPACPAQSATAMGGPCAAACMGGALNSAMPAGAFQCFWE